MSIKQSKTPFALSACAQRVGRRAHTKEFWRGGKKLSLSTFVLIVFVIATMVLPSGAFAALGINKQLSYQGTLKTSGGVNVADGNYNIVFKIYDAATTGNLLWTGTHTAGNGNAVVVTDGIFDVLFGSGSGNTLSVDFNTDTLYLGITVSADSEMTPRQRIGAAAYAFNADTLDGTGFATTTFSTGDVLYYDGSAFQRLGVGNNGQILKLNAGLPSWSADLQGPAQSNLWATTTDNLLIYSVDTSHTLVLGSNATTTTGNIFEIVGNALFGGNGIFTNLLTAYNTITAPIFTATSTTATSTFPYLAVSNNSNLGTVVGGTWQGDTVGEIYGGTGLSSYVIGDILYANGVNSLARLATSTAGSILQLNFSTGLPSYVATSTLDIALSDTTGTLAISRGGTGTTTPTGFLFGDGAGGLTSSSTIAAAYLDPLLALSTNVLMLTNWFATTTAPHLATLEGVISFIATNATTTNATSTNLAVSGTSSLTNTTNSGTLTVTGQTTLANASSTVLTITGPAYFNSSTTFNGVEYLYPNADGTNGQVLKTNGAGGLLWGTISSGTAGFFATTTDSLAIHPTDISDVLILGASATTTTGNILEVVGNSLFGGQLIVSGTATSTFAGDVAFDANTFYIDSINDSVGIGTTSPFAKLSVSGDSYFTATSTFAKGISLASSTPDITANALYNNGGTLYWNGAEVGSGSGAFISGNGSTTLSILSDLVGIGTTSPSYVLDIYATTTQNLFRAGNATTPNALVLNTNGNFGLGTSTPFTMLGVAGDSYFSATSTFAKGISLASSTPDITANVLYANGNTLFWNGAAFDAAAGGSQGQVVIINNAGTQVATSTLFITSAGNIGIGTTTPNVSAILDLDSSNKGLLLPRVALTNTASSTPLAAHVEGMVVYNTVTAGNVTPGLYVNTGTQWRAIVPSSGSIPTVTTAVVTNVTQTTASAGGTVVTDGGAGLSVRGVVWDTSPAPLISLTTKTNDGTAVSSYTSSVTGLTVGVTYYLRAYATNANGTAYGADVIFTASSIIMTTATTTSVTANTATGGGNIINDGGQAITDRGIVWDTSTNPTIALSTKTSNGTGTGLFVSNITGLATSTTYFMRAYAINSGGTGYGDEKTFTTPQLPIVTTSAITAIGADNAILGGNVTSAGGTTVTASGIVWHTTPNPAVGSNLGITTDTVQSGAFASTMTVLTVGTTYYVRAYATNVVGTTYGNQLIFIPTLNSSSQTLGFSGAAQTYTVPAGVTSVQIDTYGAQGTAGTRPSGSGGRARGILAVTPGQTLNVYVGGQAGFNGGGTGINGKNGGGGSDVRVGGTAISNRVIVAGGGGGSGNEGILTGNGSGGGGAGTAVGSNFVGGGGGDGHGFAGNKGASSGGAGQTAINGGGGAGGGLNSGGVGATATGGTSSTGNTGTLGQGGNAGVANGCTDVGAGGGGYYGGGAAAGFNCGAGQGGGGSSWTGTLTSPFFDGGVRSGNGQIIITTYINGADLAEDYPTKDNTLEAGEILSLDINNAGFVKRAELGERIIGIVSTNPHTVMGEGDYPDEINTQVALVGRVPVKVTTENGEIKIGDRITISSVAGVGMKAGAWDASVGYALDNYSSEDVESIGTILVFIQLESGMSITVSDTPFEGTVTVEDYTFEGNITVRGHAIFSGDSVGLARIKAGASEVRITFENEYQSQPIVTATPVGIHDIDYGITDITTTGFDIEIDPTQNDDITFNWHAFGGEGAKIFVSDGTVEDIVITVAGEPAPSEAGSGASAGSDGEAPVITINGNNPAEIPVGSTYSDLGATVSDNVNDNLGYKIYVDGVEVKQIQLDTSTPSTYIITYEATDQAGNFGTAERTVIVGSGAPSTQDSTPTTTSQNATTTNSIATTTTPVVNDTIAPVITLLGEATIELTLGDTYTDAGAIALDDVDGDITTNIIVDNPIDTGALGEYIITYNVSDNAGNAAEEVTRTVTVVTPPDVTPPVITLLGESTVELTVGDTYTDAGVTALDDVDGDITANIVVNNSVDTTTAGKYVITYNITDTTGNGAAEVLRTVTVIESPLESSGSSEESI